MTKLTLDNQQNIQIIKEATQNTFVDYPVLKQLTIAQAILESGLQTPRPSDLAYKYCNLFGMKPGTLFPRGTAEPYGIINLLTIECDKYHCYKLPQPFLWNAEIEDSFKQHEELFRNLDRYSPLFKCQTFTEAATTVRQCGYATDPNYPRKLLQVYANFIRGTV